MVEGIPKTKEKTPGQIPRLWKRLAGRAGVLCTEFKALQRRAFEYRGKSVTVGEVTKMIEV